MWCHVMPCHAMSFQPSTFNPIICKVYFTHHIFGYMFRFYVVWYLFQTSTGSPCLPEPPLLVQGCQLSPGRRHQANLQTSHLEAWDNFRETQSWSWFMLRPTYPYVPVLFVVFRQKMKCQNVPANLFCFATTPEVAFMAQWTALPIQ